MLQYLDCHELWPRFRRFSRTSTATDRYRASSVPNTSNLSKPLWLHQIYSTSRSKLLREVEYYLNKNQEKNEILKNHSECLITMMSSNGVYNVMEADVIDSLSQVVLVGRESCTCAVHASACQHTLPRLHSLNQTDQHRRHDGSRGGARSWGAETQTKSKAIYREFWSDSLMTQARCFMSFSWRTIRLLRGVIQVLVDKTMTPVTTCLILSPGGW